MQSRRDFLKAAGLSALASSISGCGLIHSSTPDLVWGVHGNRDGWLHKPRVAAFDTKDNLYIADLTDRIQCFTRDGQFLRGWRTPALNVDGPSGLSVDRLNRVLVADTHFYRVLVYSPAGEILMQLGDGIQGQEKGRFGYPTDVVIDKAGNFYVSEYGENDRIQVFTPDGQWVRQWGGHGYAPGEFLRPRAMAMDEDEQIYVADSCNHRIQVFNTLGKHIRSWGRRGVGLGEMAFPYDVSLGPEGDLYVCEYGNQRVQKFTTEGKPLGLWGKPGRAPGELNNPWALAVDSRGAVSVIDSNNHRVQRFRM